MLKIEEGVIYLTRGDDAVIDVQLTIQDGGAYEMQPGDTVTLTVRELPKEESEIILDSSSAPGSNRIIINSADTENAEVGQYSADIELLTEDGKRYTVWPDLEGSGRYKTGNMKNFVIMPEVTMSEH